MNMKPPRPPPPPPSLHSNFFSSLKQVEKRLKLEQPLESSKPPPSPTPLPLIESNSLAAESLSSPLYLHLDQHNNQSNSTTLPESSEPPLAFLSCSPQIPPQQTTTTQVDNPETINKPEVEAFDDIQHLIQLLGLSDSPQEAEEQVTEREREGRGCSGSGNDSDSDSDSNCNSCHCESGFYSKIVGVKGPKCGKEMQRLDGWIKYLLNDGGEERIEPLRLSLLLLGKAAVVSEAADGGFGGLEFPSALQDFLLNDPPPTT